MIQAGSLFNQLLRHFPRAEFAALVRRHEAERGAKGFTCWAQLVAMLFCPQRSPKTGQWWSPENRPMRA